MLSGRRSYVALAVRNVHGAVRPATIVNTKQVLSNDRMLALNIVKYFEKCFACRFVLS